MRIRSKYRIMTMLVAAIIAVGLVRLPAFAEEGSLGTTTSGKTAETPKTSATKVELKKTESENTTTERAVKKAENAAKNCEKIQERLAKIASKTEGNKSRNVTAYKNMHDRIAKFIKRFTDLGLDTTKLTADLSVLDTKIAKLETDHTAYVSKLAELKTASCGDAESQFKTILQEARALMTTMHADVEDIHTYWRTTIKVDLMALKAQVETKEATSVETESTVTPKTSTTTTPPTSSKEIK